MGQRNDSGKRNLHHSSYESSLVHCIPYYTILGEAVSATTTATGGATQSGGGSGKGVRALRRQVRRV